MGFQLILHVGIENQHASLEISDALMVFASMPNVGVTGTFTVTIDPMSSTAMREVLRILYFLSCLNPNIVDRSFAHCD